MRIVHIGYTCGTKKTGGAAIAATRLHRALLSKGFDSHFVCLEKTEACENVYVLPHFCLRLVHKVLVTSLRRLLTIFGVPQTVSLHLIPLFGLKNVLRTLKPDVLHVHWVNVDILSFKQMLSLRKMAGDQCRIIFNLHDFYLINASAPYPREDERYIVGFTDKNSTWWERYLFDHKVRVASKLNPRFVGPSQWVIDCCKRSLIGCGRECLVIPNIVDHIKIKQSAFCDNEKKKMQLLFGAFGGRRNPSKGWYDLESALNLLPLNIAEKMELRVFGESADPMTINGVCVSFEGSLSGNELARVYSEADLFLFPSIEETQGMAKIEAMLYGKPVVAFDRTACAEGLACGKTGWIAGGVEDFADGILYYFEKWKNGSINSETIARIAREEYSVDVIIRKIIAAYTT